MTANIAPAAAGSPLISREHREIQQKLHENPEYDMASVVYAPIVADIARALGATELLDYGAGKGRLGHTGAALKSLSDGRNAHLIQRPVSWWLPKFMERFELTAYNRMPSGFWVAVERAHASGNSPGNASAN